MYEPLIGRPRKQKLVDELGITPLHCDVMLPGGARVRQPFPGWRPVLWRIITEDMIAVRDGDAVCLYPVPFDDVLWGRA